MSRYRPKELGQRKVEWVRMLEQAQQADLWGQVVEAAEGYQR